MKIANFGIMKREIGLQKQKLLARLNAFRNELKNDSASIQEASFNEFDKISMSICSAINEIEQDKEFLTKFLGKELTEFQDNISMLLDAILMHGFDQPMRSGRLDEIINHFSDKPENEGGIPGHPTPNEP